MHLCPSHNNSPVSSSDLKEVPGVTVTALQESSLSLLGEEAGNVTRDSNIDAVHDRQNQLRPAGGGNTKHRRGFTSS